MQKLTKEQAIIIMGFTGFTTTVKFGDFHEEVERRLGRPIFTHEFADEVVIDEITAAFKNDFISMCLGEKNEIT